MGLEDKLREINELLQEFMRVRYPEKQLTPRVDKDNVSGCMREPEEENE